MIIPVTIKVTGPGGCINVEIELIKREFEKRGAVVHVKNEHPIEKDMKDGKYPSGETLDEFLQRINYKDTVIIIEANHIPWGG